MKNKNYVFSHRIVTELISGHDIRPPVSAVRAVVDSASLQSVVAGDFAAVAVHLGTIFQREHSPQTLAVLNPEVQFVGAQLRVVHLLYGHVPSPGRGRQTPGRVEALFVR